MYLLPTPKKADWREGNCCLRYDGKIVIGTGCGKETLFQARLLKEDIEKNTGFSYGITRGGEKEGQIYLTLDEKLGEQNYRLSVAGQGICLTGGDDAGLLYAVQTLRQMLAQAGAYLPAVEIEDGPLMPNRGFYHDVTRGRIPTLEYLKSLADTMSFYKMNQLQLYIEHSFLLEGLSEMWRDDTPLTAEEILELDEYCSHLGIELVPSLSSFGHLYKLLRTKTFAHLCEMEDPEKEPFSFIGRQEHHTIDVTQEESFTLVRRLIEEYLPLFRSKQFNIGADETFDLGKGKSKALADEIGVKEVYINFVNRLCNLVIDLGSRPMFWGDVICGVPEMIQRLPKETICLNWGYAWNQTEDSTKALAEAGAVQYVCPGVGGWNQWVSLLDSCYQNITRMGEYGKKYHAIGMLNTDWGDYGHINHQNFSIPGMIYGAVSSWSGQVPEFAEVNRQISKLEYRDHSESLLEIVDRVGKMQGFGWDVAVRYQEVFTANGKKHELEQLFESRKNGILKAGELIEKLEAEKVNLCRCTAAMDIEKKKRVMEFQIAVEAIQIFNEIGAVILKRKYGLDCGFDMDPVKLAEKLEHWYLYYKDLWRSTSKESELYQISNVIFWYGDHLRELEGAL